MLKNYQRVINRQLCRQFNAKYSVQDQDVGFDRKIYLLNDQGQKISFWNDVKLQEANFDADVFNMVVEMPRYTLAKLELARDQVNHPIVHDLRQNIFNPSITELRYYAQFGFWNYGLLPQTWESIVESHSDMGGVKGDNDPLDILEVSDIPYKPGSIIQVKAIGAFASIDQGELDWKIISVEVNEAKRRNISTLEDLEREYPSRLQDTKRWFKVIKTFDRKPANTIHFDEKIFGREKTLGVIEENHQYWKELRNIMNSRTETRTQKQRELLKIAENFHM